jgi:hypothetical protein
MQNIPCIRIGNSNTAFGDFNGDGIDELFILDFGRFNMLYIEGYDEENDSFKRFLEITFDVKDWNQSLSPINYLTYDGMYGFYILYISYYESGDYYVVDPDTGKYIFYAWDDDQRHYIRFRGQ